MATPTYRRAQRRKRTLKRVVGAIAAYKVARTVAPKTARRAGKAALAAGALFHANKAVRWATRGAENRNTLQGKIARGSRTLHYKMLRGLAKTRRAVRQAGQGALLGSGAAGAKAVQTWSGMSKGQKRLTKVGAAVGGYLAYRKVRKAFKGIRAQRAANRRAQGRYNRNGALQRPKGARQFIAGLLTGGAAGAITGVGAAVGYNRRRRAGTAPSTPTAATPKPRKPRTPKPPKPPKPTKSGKPRKPRKRKGA